MKKKIYLCPMLKEFKTFISDQNLFEPNDRILLAVSGGIDSVVMSELFHKAGYAFGIAHCNFTLRGKESDADETFVEKLAGKYKVPFYTKRFLTTKVTKEKGISIQMAARELRYQWFEELRLKEKYHSIATAHHLDDQVETFFINLLRSTGIAGFHGILPRQGNLTRPLLFSYRDDIEAFARKYKLVFREDSSNLETKYLRNKIRHEVIPIFRELNPAFPHILTETILRMRETEVIFRNSIEEARKKIIRNDKNGTHIRIENLKKLTPVDIYAFELLSPYGFNETVIRDILHSPDDSSGKIFYSSTHRLIKNREELILNPLPDKKETWSKNAEISIPENKKEIRKPIHLSFTKTATIKRFVIDPSKEVANLDLRKIVFPLILRRWKKGDSFYPFGMNKKKKLSDYFIDSKLSIPEKENTWLLCSGTHILWIVGYRIDHRFRVTSQTKEVFQVRWLKEKIS
ncbi:MAG TPA: tRNA lysidine(34) synthetase TilS [Bacteroidales bacterium]|nr:tRNA lysidine(34) synthetase TilS [Bacteroidales bacterium]